MNSSIQGFVDFIRKQGVVGLAIGFILGGAVQKVVTALIEDIVNPIVGLLIGSADSLAQAKLKIGPLTLALGHFASVLLDFIVIAAVVYYGFKMLGIEKIDKPKDSIH